MESWLYWEEPKERVLAKQTEPILQPRGWEPLPRDSLASSALRLRFQARECVGITWKTVKLLTPHQVSDPRGQE